MTEKVFFVTIEIGGKIWLEHMDLTTALVVQKQAMKKELYLGIGRVHVLSEEQCKIGRDRVV